MVYTATWVDPPRNEAEAFLVSVASKLKRRFVSSPPDASSAKLIAQLIAYASEAQRLVEEQSQRISQLEALSITDEMTGLLNTRGFRMALESAITDSRRHGDQGTLAFIDLDGLKRVNDRFGHAAGDAALVAVGCVLRERIRLTDAAGRLHGDEFAVLFCRSSPAHAEDLVGRLREALSAVPVEIGRHSFIASASVGSTIYGPDCDADLLLAAADAGMYRAKRGRAGRLMRLPAAR